MAPVAGEQGDWGGNLITIYYNIGMSAQGCLWVSFFEAREVTPPKKKKVRHQDHKLGCGKK
jgi:hypothetical protein